MQHPLFNLTKTKEARGSCRCWLLYSQKTLPDALLQANFKASMRTLTFLPAVSSVAMYGTCTVLVFFTSHGWPELHLPNETI